MLSVSSRLLMMLFSAPMTFCSCPAKVCTMYQRPGRSKALSMTGSSSRPSSRIVTSRISSSALVSWSVSEVSISLMIALLGEEERDELRETEAQAENQRGHEDEDEEHDSGVVDQLRSRRPGDLTHLFTDFTDELTGASALAPTALDVLGRGAAWRSGAVGAHLSLSLHHSLLFAIHLTSLVTKSVTSGKKT